VNPEDMTRYFLGRPADAFRIMRKQGVGITNRDLRKIPVGIPDYPGVDTDKDGVPNSLEETLGFDVAGTDTDKDGHSDLEEIRNNYGPQEDRDRQTQIEPEFAARQAGHIFLQVQEQGQAWYVDPKDNHRYFLGRPADAFAIMRSRGLGISNSDLESIMATTPHYLLSDFVKKVHKAVNRERTERKLGKLAWDPKLASVARLHSLQLARKNQDLTAFGASCDYPMIHHEGLEHGPYVSDRLHNQDIYYYQKNGENIALVSAAKYQIQIRPGSQTGSKIDKCQSRLKDWNSEFKSDLHQDLSDQEKLARVREEEERRKQAFGQADNYELYKVNWLSEDQAVDETVQGWLESPGHRENMLDKEFAATGIGAAYVNGYLISTQVFIKPADCGYQTGPCCQKEGYYPYCFQGLECSSGTCLSSKD